jgi:protein-S-isoprenylcysteine O-methyltransferase Ste14
VIDRPALVRLLALYLPVALTAALWVWRRPGRRRRVACLLSGLWNLPVLLGLHALATHLGWWSFEAQGGLLAGMPVDLYLGWALLWGPVPALAFPRLPLPAIALAALWIDAVAMPAMTPVLRLGPGWLSGELLGLAVGLLPAQCLARWTAEDRHLAARATLQLGLFGGMTLGVVPAMVLDAAGGTWTALATTDGWRLGLELQLVAAAGLLGVSAVQEFVERGRGTAVPFDPPRRLVTSGPYAYVANPMQLSGMLVLATWGLALESLWVVAAAVMAHLYGLGIAGWDEGRDLEARFGTRWGIYRRAVRRWWPRLRPWHPTLDPAWGPAEPARLYVAWSCGMCAGLGAWLARRRPVGLVLLAAEDHPARDLTRLTYDPGDGSGDETGIGALARALQHVHFGYALVGLVMRLPVVHGGLTLLADVSAGPPRVVRRTTVPGA